MQYQLEYLKESTVNFFKELASSRTMLPSLHKANIRAKLEEELETKIRAEFTAEVGDQFSLLKEQKKSLATSLKNMRDEAWNRTTIPTFSEFTYELKKIVADIVSNEILDAELSRLESGTDSRDINKIIPAGEKAKIVARSILILEDSFEVGFMNTLNYYYTEAGLSDLVMREATNIFLSRVKS